MAEARDSGISGAEAAEDSFLRLRWNSHLESLQHLFENLLEQQKFVDVTLACEGGSLRAHRVMLSACSAYFKRVLNETTSKHPVIIMRDVSLSEMDSILQFIYRGEIHVPELRLPSLLKTAKLLEIRGLSDHLDKPENEVEDPPRKRRNSQVNGEPTTNASKPKKSSADQQTKTKDLENGSAKSELPSPAVHTTKLLCHQQMKVGAETVRSCTPLDLSGDASDEENEMPSEDLTKKDSTSPVPVLVKSESMRDVTDATDAASEEGDVDADDAGQYPFSMLEDQSGSVVVQAVCPFCFKDCKRTAELRAHIRAHTGEKPFRCDICSAPFARSAHLKRHRRVHTGERPFECHRCQKTFSRQDKLKLHMDRHRLRDSGGKMIVGRPKKDAQKKPTGKANNHEEILQAGTSSTASSSLASPAHVELGMGQFAFPGAPARPGPAQSPGLPLPFSDISYFSLLSLTQQRAGGGGANGGGGGGGSGGGGPGGGASSASSPQGDLPSPTVPHLLSPQALQELQLYRQATTSPRGGRHRVQSSGSQRGRTSRSSTGSAESASETLLNFAQQVGEVAHVAATPPPTQT